MNKYKRWHAVEKAICWAASVPLWPSMDRIWFEANVFNQGQIPRSTFDGYFKAVMLCYFKYPDKKADDNRICEYVRRLSKARWGMVRLDRRNLRLDLRNPIDRDNIYSKACAAMSLLFGIENRSCQEVLIIRAEDSHF